MGVVLKMKTHGYQPGFGNFLHELILWQTLLQDLSVFLQYLIDLLDISDVRFLLFTQVVERIATAIVAEFFVGPPSDGSSAGKAVSCFSHGSLI